MIIISILLDRGRHEILLVLICVDIIDRNDRAIRRVIGNRRPVHEKNIRKIVGCRRCRDLILISIGIRTVNGLTGDGQIRMLLIPCRDLLSPPVLYSLLIRRTPDHDLRRAGIALIEIRRRLCRGRCRKYRRASPDQHRRCGGSRKNHSSEFLCLHTYPPFPPESAVQTSVCKPFHIFQKERASEPFYSQVFSPVCSRLEAHCHPIKMTVFVDVETFSSADLHNTQVSFTCQCIPVLSLIFVRFAQN